MTNKDGRELKDLLKRAIEAAAPDLRQVMALPRRAKVVAVKPAGGTYVCTVQACLADGRPDPAAPVVPEVEIPSLWAGPGRGLVCPPMVGEYCDLGYYDGDPNCPFITNFRPREAPAAELDSLIIQHSPGIRLGFKPDGTVIVEAPKVEVTATERVIIKAPLIQLEGRVEVKGGIYTTGGAGGSGMEITGQVKIKQGGLDSQGHITTAANVEAGGDVKAGGKIEDAGGNTNHHSH